MTITIRSDFIIESDEIYTTTSGPAFYSEHTSFTFVNYGLIRATGPGAVGFYSFTSSGLVHNAGVMEIHGTGTTYGFYSPQWFAAIRNTGSVSVSGDNAYGLLTWSPDQIFDNAGSLTVTATYSATGLLFVNGTNLTNTGSITVTAGQNATGVYIDRFEGGVFENIGSIAAHSGNQSFGLVVSGLSNTVTSPNIINRGTISADVAILAADGGYSPQQPTIQNIANYGTLNGFISLAVGADVLTNFSVINGDVDMGAGADTVDLTGGWINGVVDLGEDDDTATGSSGNDTFFGYLGRDIIRGEGGHDFIDGEQGNDTLSGGAGNDTLLGGSGSDIINGDEGDDVVEGGSGNDTINGGAGDDIAVFLGTRDSYTITKSGDSVTVIGADGTDTLLGVEGALFSDGYFDISGKMETTTLHGTIAGETLTGASGADIVHAGAGNDTVYGLAGIDFLDGGNGDDILNGGEGHDTMNGGDGADIAVFAGPRSAYTVTTINGTTRVIGPEGFDSLINVEYIRFDDVSLVLGEGGGYYMIGTSASDVLSGSALNDRIEGGAGDDVLTGRGGIDTILGGDGHDTAVFSTDITYTATRTGEITTVIGTGTSTTLIGVEALRVGQYEIDITGPWDRIRTATNFEGWESINGSIGRDILYGLNGFDALYGEGGDDRLDGGEGDDSLIGGDGTDELFGQNGVDSLWGGFGDDSLHGGAGNDILNGEAGNDTIVSGLGNDLINGGDGSDTAVFGSVQSAYTLSRVNGVVTVSGPEGTDNLTNVEWIRFSDQRVAVSSIPQIMMGTPNSDMIDGSGGDDIIQGLAGSDILSGNDGNDRLNGGAGNDSLIGGTGIDTADYAGAAAGVVASLTLGSASNDGDGGSDGLSGIENLIGSAFGDQLTGSGGNNTLSGGAGADTLLGLGGDDIIAGGAGNDVLNGGTGIDLLDYSGAAAGVRAQLNTGAASNDGDGGSDTLSGFEHLTGSDFNDLLVGDGGVNILRGGLGTDLLIGGAGNDIIYGGTGLGNELYGGTGDDLFVLEANDTVVEFAGEGTDTVEVRIAVYNLGANLERLVFTGTGGFTGTGNAAANTIIGGAGDDVLRGRGGDDQLTGGAGIDTADYTQATSAILVRLDSVITLNDGEGGRDFLTGIENITGSQYNDVIVGDAGANVLMGGLGMDVLLGGAGDDVLMGGQVQTNQVQGGLGNDYYILDAADTVIENAGEGIDTVESRVSTYTLAANVENLLYTGPASFSGWGNGLDNRITGGVADDYLRGMGGNDTIDGGLGTDSLYLRGVAADYTVTAEGDGWRIVDAVGGRDGSTFVTSIELLRFSNGGTRTLDYGSGGTPAGTPKDAGGPQVSRVLDEAPTGLKDAGPQVQPAVLDDAFILTTKGDAAEPQVQPGAFDDGFLNLKSGSDSTGPQIQPGVFDDRAGPDDTGGLGFDVGGHGFGGGGSGGSDGSGAWGLDLDIQRALDDHAIRMLHNQTADADPWG